MDAFYASVEQRDNPKLKHLPIAVGGGDARGVVCAASYEARRWGVRSAMSGQRAKRLCPELIFVSPRFERYKEVSQHIHGIFKDYTDLIEPLSLDEAFLDVSENKQGISLAKDVALAIKSRIRHELGLTASAGVSYNKFLAKVASDYRKPDGLCVIHPAVANEFIASLPIEHFWGVGRMTAQRMHSEGIHSGKELQERSLEELIQLFGKMGYTYYDFARGIDHRPVEQEWHRKSLGCEYTLAKDSKQWDELKSIVAELASELEQRSLRAMFIGRTLVLKVKYYDFKQLTRSYTSTTALLDSRTYREIALYLLRQVDTTIPIRLLGLSLAQPLNEGAGELWYQPLLFDDDTSTNF